MSQETESPRIIRTTGRRKSLRTAVDIYLSDVSRRWRKAVEGSDRVLVLSPYLTSKTAEAILEATLGEHCEVYTVFQAENFVSGASSIHTLMKLQRHGCALYDLPDLHAKIILVPGHFASIGSQNVTRRGRQNKEATSIFTAEETELAISEMVEPWLEERLPITTEMIDEINLALHPLMAAMRKVQKACKALDEKVWEEERLRAAKRARLAEQERQEAKIRKAEQERRLILICKVMAAKGKIESIREQDDFVMASSLIESSAWWLTQRYGPTPAPGHKNRLYGNNGSWAIEFGSNVFHVSYAIKRCLRTLELTFRTSARHNPRISARWP
jgi:hypothetical protein